MSGASLGSRIAFRFAAPYFLLFSVYTSDLPLVSGLLDRIGEALFGRGFGENGSGDRSADYLTVFFLAAIAGVIGSVWTAIERNRTYPRASAWLVVWARYWLATIMFTYGAGKVFAPRQFPVPDLVTLTQTFGESSPMALAWTFMGHSQGYTAFAGAAEVLGAVLLCFRRTTTLGALVCVGVMTNVVALNLCYDIPVKLYSMHLLAVSLALVWVDRERLMNVFVLGTPVAAHTVAPVLPDNPRLRIGAKVGYILFIFATYLAEHNRVARVMATTGTDAIFEVEDDQLVCAPQLDCDSSDRVSRPAPPNLAIRRIVVAASGRVAFDVQTGERRIETGGFDDDETVLELDTGERWTIERLDDDRLVLEGPLGSVGAQHRLIVRRGEVRMLLRERGFSWISESPRYW